MLIIEVREPYNYLISISFNSEKKFKPEKLFIQMTPVPLFIPKVFDYLHDQL